MSSTTEAQQIPQGVFSVLVLAAERAEQPKIGPR